MECFSMSTVYRFTSCNSTTNSLGARMPWGKVHSWTQFPATAWVPAASAHLEAALEQINQRWKENILFRLAHFKYPKRVITLRVHVHGEQHGAVNTAPLCVRYPQVHALIVCLHIVAEFRLHPAQIDVMGGSTRSSKDTVLNVARM